MDVTGIAWGGPVGIVVNKREHVRSQDVQVKGVRDADLRDVFSGGTSEDFGQDG